MAWSRDVDRFSQAFSVKDPADLGMPGANYYWERKRRLVLDLLQTHCAGIGLEAPAFSPLFVDLGCGEGRDMVLVAKFFEELRSRGKQAALPWRFIGIDGYPPSLEICRERMKKHEFSQGEVRVSNITKKLPLQDGEVDVLYCSEVLEHIPNFDEMIEEMNRVVKTGGYVLMTTPNQPNVFQRSYWSPQHFERMQATGKPVHKAVDIAGEKVDLHGHISLHRASQWDRIFENHSFKCVDQRRGATTYGGVPFLNRAPFHQMQMALEWTLDRLPRRVVRELSDQVITLFRKTGNSDGGKRN